MCHRIGLLCAALAMLPLFGSSASAATYTWNNTSTASGNYWSTVGNWDGAVPAAADSIILSNGGAIDLNTTWGSVTNIGTAETPLVGSIINGSLSYTGSLYASSGSLSTALLLGASSTFTKIGSGTLTINNAATTLHNGTTNINDGELVIIRCASSAAGSIVNNASLRFVFSSSSTFSTILGGTGSVTIAGAGRTTLDNTNTYTGDTIINSGSWLRLGANTRSGSVGGNILNSGTLSVYSGTRSDSCNNKITGTGLLLKEGSGTATVNNANDAFGSGINVGAGTLVLNNWDSIGTGITNSGTLTFNNSTDKTVAVAISDGTAAGAVIKTGVGKLTLTGASSGTGTLTVNEGTLQFGDGAANGSFLAGYIINNASLVFNVAEGTSQTFTKYINSTSGTGTITKTGAGSLAFSTSNSNNFGSDIVVSQGSLAVAGWATASADASIALDANTSLTLSNANASKYWSGAISGDGAVTIKNGGGGTVTLLGDNSYTGGTTIDSNVELVIGNSSYTATLPGNVVNNGTLNLNRWSSTTTGAVTNNGTVKFTNSASKTWRGVIGGAGSVVISTSGTDTSALFAADQLYTGDTIINPGASLILSSLSSGAGYVAGNIVNNGVLKYNVGYVTGDTTTYGNVEYAKTISGAGSFVKLNAGTLTLKGTNEFTGGCGVEGLLVLGESGSILLNVNNSNMCSQIAQFVDNDPERNDVDGSLKLCGTLKLDIAALTDTTGSWNLIDSTLSPIYDSTFKLMFNDGSGSFSAGPTSGVLVCSNSLGSWRFNETSGLLTLNVVPEPGAIAMLASALLGLIAYAWRRRK